MLAGAGEIALWLRVLALAKALDLVANTHMVTCNHL